MKNTNTIFVETEPDKKDFVNIDLEYGELLNFNGNTCTHFNKSNNEGKLRISLDFRIILVTDYINYLKSSKILSTNPRDIERKRDKTSFTIGNYYQIKHIDDTIDDFMDWFKIKNKILQHRPYFETEETNAITNYMNNDSFLTEYKKTNELENNICNYLGVKHCIMTTSGTSALLISLMSLELNEGDEVIVPNYTMIATINVIKMLKLKPVICDIDAQTCTLNLDGINNNITSKTKCVIHVSLNNRCVDLDKIKLLCKNKNIYLLEDAAQSMGCKVNNKYLGTFGDLGCFSLSTPKIISTGQGGFVISNNDKLIQKIKMIKNFGRESSGQDNFMTFGLNFKFTDLQAVIGIEQLKKLDERAKRMREMYNLYYEYLKDEKHILIKKPLNDTWFPWFIDIYTENRENLVNFLKKHNIESRPVYQEINKTSIYYSEHVYKNSKLICNNGLFMPSHIKLTNKEIKYICKIIKLFKFYV